MSTDLTNEQKPDQKAEQKPELETAAHSNRVGLIGRARQTEMWRSVFRHPPLNSPRGRALQSFSNVFLHLYPVKVPVRVLRWRYSLRLGFIAIVLFTVLVVTGVYLMFFYSPTPAAAYGDMVQLKTGIGFGQLVRNVHRWSAHLMVLVVVVHLGGCSTRARTSGLDSSTGFSALHCCSSPSGSSFTGYLLPWDQLSYWAVTVGTNMVNYVPLVGKYVRDILLGGSQISGATLQRFYALHVAILPLSLTLILPVHIWRVRKDGFAVERGSTGALDPKACPGRRASTAALATAAQNGKGDGKRTRLLGVVDRESVTQEEQVTDDTVFAWPHLMVRHVVATLGVCATVLALGVWFQAPLKDIANPNLTPEPAKAPWYFEGCRSCCRASIHSWPGSCSLVQRHAVKT